ncbi:hypothetical protein Y032_0134g1805 [Ancylostoma ceylanicum]|uniref:Core-2/I-Branching enzyme n=1 Tax=Ancylostoma ceylanicum TaxID=53326 RepID=A0A016T5R2_9BILA|nr:hypothetical protein Y032_0134g1805 [Ancylostoma ceylanicum]
MYSHLFNNDSPYQGTSAFAHGLNTIVNMLFSQEVCKPSYSRWKRIETARIDCGRVIRGDQEYTSYVAKNRPTIVHNDQNVSCAQLRRRILPPTSMKPIPLGVAFARIVYRDYELIEDELRSSYHPQNYFCYSIDQKADKKFRSNMKRLAQCLPNVVVSSDEFNIDEGGHYMNIAHYRCMQLLLKKSSWGYILLLQNHDIVIKSPHEIAEIYSLLDGANDVQVTRCGEDLCGHDRSWNPRSLNLFLNESALSEKLLNTHLDFAKGYVQASLSRAAVEWLVHTVNVTTLIEQLNKKSFGLDEIWLATLQVSNELGMPGGFTADCLKQGKDTASISRLSAWTSDRNYKGCKSGYARKSICIYGIEDLQTLMQFPHITANKMLPEFDYGVIECVHETIFNRTFLDQTDHPLDRDIYANMANVKYHKNRRKPDPNFKLECVRAQRNIDELYTASRELS